VSGPNNLWRMHQATRKGPNPAPCTIFFFDKKDLKESKGNVEEIAEFLKKDSSMLSKMKHPNILQLIELPLEDKSTLAFVTEPVLFPLSYLFDNYKMKKHIPGGIEIKLILLQILEALHFLHINAKRVHCMLSPDNVYITKEG
jgi:SCY1-like protein 2